ncbi:YheT family hydrolase [Chitinophaga skermanii]|uniref:YheT family hydrolase n=1 Tax=Chitinophaga skermanii TaxID=331697 RepID=UPI001B88343A|nr:alpha/beta fold hydrolase [Chitinophaga skermanii]
MQTIYPTLFRRIDAAPYVRRRIDTPDGDFLDLDLSSRNNKKAVLILHGLEGNSTRKYVMGMVHMFNKGGYDTISMNFRGCSGEPNRAMRFYHSGDTGDIATVIDYIFSLQQYEQLHIVGFSLGGNVTLKYVGEQGKNIDPRIRSAVAISVPCDLMDSSVELEKPHNVIYMTRFIRNLEEKLRLKSALFPGKISLTGFKEIKTFRQFDDRYTAPIHGFNNALEYWEKSSSKQFLHQVSIPTLLVNALNDPFLGEGCFPFDAAEENPHFFLETPGNGGHVGFVTFSDPYYWTEKRAFDFIDKGL